MGVQNSEAGALCEEPEAGSCVPSTTQCSEAVSTSRLSGEGQEGWERCAAGSCRSSPAGDRLELEGQVG